MNYMLAWKGAYGVSDHDGIVSPAYSVFKIDQDIVGVRYLHHRVRSDDMKAYFRSRSKGIIESRLRLYPDSLLASFVEIPDLATQHQIADFLDRETARIDLLIEKKQHFVALLGEKTAETIRQCVSWGMDSNAPKKPSRVPAADDLAAHWTEQRLSTICRFVQGKAHEPFIEDDGEYICVTARFVSTNGEKFRRCTKNLTPGKANDLSMVMQGNRFWSLMRG